MTADLAVVAPGVPLLTEAPAGRHFAQLHRNSDLLVEAAGVFLEAGLRRDTGIVIIAVPEHTEPLLRQLEAGRLHAEAMRQSGQLAVVDAEAALGEFLHNGSPDWSDFRAGMGGLLERLQAFGRGTRVYCELADLLWRDGRSHAAIRLEEFWTALGRLVPFSLYCTYMLDPQHEDSYTGPLEEIGRTHSDILGTVEDARFGEALDAASQELYGIPLSKMIGFSAAEDGERRFPSGQRTMLWVRRNLPSSSAPMLERAHQYYHQATV